MAFSPFKLHPDLLRGVSALGFTRPTPIQSDTIPPALQGKDILACASTGSGKTAAFLLPTIHRLIGKKRGVTRALILTPTRELAAQVAADLDELAVHTPVTGAAVFGGVGMAPQEHAFRSGVDVIIATPGRLLDHLKQPYAKLDHLEVLVLDEADRMLDMGFLPDIKRILRHVPPKRQTLFFSATMPSEIGALAQAMLTRPVTVNLERRAAPAVGITQAVYPVAQELKSPLLIGLLKRGDIGSVLVFTRTKHRANRLATYLTKQGVSAERIHGQRSQGQRTLALEGFKKGTFQVLVATDIAARGIDVAELGHVINFDVPGQSEDYIHRVGRTARAEATGHAFTFVAPDEEADLRAIEKAIGKRLPRVTLPDFDYTSKPVERLEVPIAERIAKIRERKRQERANAAAKAERKQQAKTGTTPGKGAVSGRSSGEKRRGAKSDDASPYAPSPATKGNASAAKRRRRRRKPGPRGRGETGRLSA